MASKYEVAQVIDDVIDRICSIFPRLADLIRKLGADARKRLLIGLPEVQDALDLAEHMDKCSDGYKILYHVVKRVLLNIGQGEARESDARKSDEKAKRKYKNSNRGRSVRRRFIQETARETRSAKVEAEEKSSTLHGERVEFEAQTAAYPDADEEETKEEGVLQEHKEGEISLDPEPVSTENTISHFPRMFPTENIPPPPVQPAFGDWISMRAKKQHERENRALTPPRVIDLCSDTETEHVSEYVSEDESFESEPDEEKSPGNVRGEY